MQTLKPSTLIPAILSVALCAPAFADTVLPAPYRAEYEARASGMKATAYRQLEQIAPDRYALSNSLSLAILGASLGRAEERSEFSVGPGEEDGSPAGQAPAERRHLVVPHAYRYEQTGISRSLEVIEFDWTAHEARSQEDDEQVVLPFQEGIQDKLSFTVQLALDLATLTEEELATGVSFDYRIIDADDIDEHRYRIGGREAITTPLGDIDTVRLERIRNPESRRQTVFWLSVERDFLLVKFEQTSSSGSKTELLLQSVANIPDTPAP